MLEGIKLESETKLLKYNVSRIQGGSRWCNFSLWGVVVFDKCVHVRVGV